MAEIDIEKKKPIWPWILLVLIILAILYFLVFDNEDEEVMDEVDTEQIDDGVMEDENTDTWEEEQNDTLSWNYDSGSEVRSLNGEQPTGIS